MKKPLRAPSASSGVHTSSPSHPSYSPGDVVTLRQREDGSEFPALIDHVTKGGRVVAVWQRRERRGRGELTKPATLDPDRFEIIGHAPESDRYHLTKLAESRR